MSLRYSTLDALVDQHDAFLLDQFGVLMSGDGPYPGAAEALSYLRRHGKPALILSNSGKRAAPNCARLLRHGFERGDFITVLTSGEVARDHILHELGRTIPRGGKVLVLIRDEDTPPLDGVDLDVTDKPEEADMLFIVSRDPARRLTSYEPILEQLAARDIPCLCVNPDMKMLTPTGLMSSAGRLAEIYAGLGARVQWFGKPHSLIYQKAIEMLRPIPPKRILCIGDSLSHDIRGGRDAGCKTALVRTGIHAGLSDMELVAEADALNLRPDYYLGAFRRDLTNPQ